MARSPRWLSRVAAAVSQRVRLLASGDPWGRETTGARPAYDGAGGGRRFRDFYAPALGPNAALAGSLDVLRNRSRAAVRSNPWAANAIDALTANLVGTHIKPEPQFPDPEFRKRVAELWADWTDEADADGVTDFYGLQAIAATGLFEAGEIFGRLRPRLLSDGLSVPLQVQLLEAEHVPTWKTELVPGGGKIIAGIELGLLGQRVAYHMYPEHPGEMVATPGAVDLVRVPAGSVIHVFKRRRPGQMRGEPQSSRVTLRLNNLDEYDDAELERKKAAANIAGVLECTDPALAAEALGSLQSNPDLPATALETKLEPGTVVPAYPGWKFSSHTPADVGPNFDVFVKHQLHGLAAGMGLPFEELAWDFSESTYSSARQAMLQHRRRIEPLRHHVLVFQFCRAVWTAWMDAAVASGALRAPGYATRRREYQRVKWIAQGWPWIDPLKDGQAAELRVRNGFTSRSAVVAEDGENVTQVDEENRQDNERADRMGLRYDSDGRQPKTGASAAPAATEDAPAPRRAQGGSRG